MANRFKSRISKNHQYFKYHRYTPNIVSHENTLDSLNACLSETANKKIVENNSYNDDDNNDNSDNNDNNDNRPPVLTIQNCNDTSINNNNNNNDEIDNVDDDAEIDIKTIKEKGEGLMHNRDLVKLKLGMNISKTN